MSSSTPIYIYLTTSIDIRLTHGSRKTVTNTKFHKKGQAYQKMLSENVFWLPYQIPSNPDKSSLYVHGHPNKLPPKYYTSFKGNLLEIQI